MKILFTITPAFNPNEGGVQRTTYKLGRFFTENGYEVAYYSFSCQNHIVVQWGKLFNSSFPGSSQNSANIDDLEHVLNKWHPDIVINQMPYDHKLRELLFHAKKGLGYLLVGCLRNSLFNFKSNARYRMKEVLPKSLLKIFDNEIGEILVQTRHKYSHRKDLKAIIDQHDYFVLLAPTNRPELQYFVGDYKSEKIRAIPNSIPKVMSGLPQKEKVILHVGRLDIQQKRSDLLIPFWEETHGMIPDWKFLIVGGGDYYSKLESQIRDSGLPRVFLEGFQKPEEYYLRASIFMMPSAYEGFPNTLIESQSYGCVPVVFNTYSTLEYVLTDGHDGLLIDPFDLGAMSRRTVELILNEKKLKSMQSLSLQNATRFTIDRVGELWQEFFYSVLK